MIYGIGTDIVELSRIESMWSRYGARFAERLLSSNELSDFQTTHDAPRFLAKHFAAKEAFAKAVGSGFRAPVSLRRISVTHDALGKPELRFDETLSLHLAKLGINRHHVSISDERDLIVAFVVLESDR